MNNPILIASTAPSILPIINNQDIPEFTDISDIHNTLHNRGCRRCTLGFQQELNGCCVSRGTFDTNKMIIGEAPGKEEDATGLPFTGPAGKLLDKIWLSVGMNTDDWYLSNIMKCRPIAHQGKENFTPKVEQIETCSIYINEEIGLLKPKIIVTLGAIATSTLLNIKRFRMQDYRGKLINTVLGDWREHNTLVFPMIHPAALLHSKGNKEQYKLYRSQTWEDIQRLKQILIDFSIGD